MRKSRLFMILLTLYCVIAVQAQNIRYVTESGNGDGTSWAEASGDIQEMIDQLYTKGGGQVWVATGTYTPTLKIAERDVNGTETTDEDKTFIFRKNVRVYGGFSGAGNEGSLDDRDWAANPTILNGELHGGKNAYHVVTFYGGISSSTCLDGFTVRGGKAIGQNGNILVNNNTIDRAYGGGIYITDATPRFNNLIIEDNSAQNGGGGIAIVYKSKNDEDIRISNSSIQSNEVLTESTEAPIGGGGIAMALLDDTDCSLTLLNSSVTDNHSNSRAGGILINHEYGNLTMIGVKVQNNICERIGGGIHGGGSHYYKDVDIIQNQGTNGGGCYLGGSLTVEMENVRITDNTGVDEGTEKVPACPKLFMPDPV